MADYNSDRTGSNIDFTLDKVDALDAKVQPTASGVDVTGTLTADGLTVDGDSNLGSTTKGVQFTTLGTGSYKMVGGNSAVSSASFTIDAKAIDAAVLHLATDGVNHLSIAQNGDISFYEDTGTTAKMVWDASAESLGIGTTAPFTTLALPFGAGIGIGDASINTIVSRSSVFPRVTTIADSYDNASSRIDFTMRAGATEENTPLSILASGNVGIGTASPDVLLEVVGADPVLTIRDTETAGSLTNATLRLAETGAGDVLNNHWDISHTSGSALAFKIALGTTASEERARIDSSGNLLVGKTALNYNNNGTGLLASGEAQFTATAINPLEINRKVSDGSIINFRKDGTTVGSIGVTGSTTSYNTSSDERLKENIQDTTHAVNIDDIKVREYDWKVDGSHQRYGFIAQELETVYPEAVHSPEDADEMKSVDYSKLVPLLVKEIQILKTRIEILESK